MELFFSDDPIQSRIGFCQWILSFGLWDFTAWSEAQWRAELARLIAE